MEIDETQKTVYISKSAGAIVKSVASFFLQTVREISNSNYQVEVVDDFLKTENGFAFATFEQLKDFKEFFTLERKQCVKDGFCVCKKEKMIFVLSHTEIGVYYGVHELLERNLPVIFSRGAKEEAIAYLSTDNCFWANDTFIENPIFYTRSWNLCGTGSEGRSHYDNGTAEFLARNKANAIFHEIDESWREYGLFHNGKRVLSAQCFDDVMEEYPEYFMTDEQGNPKKAFGGYESFPNYYSEAAAKFLAKRLVEGATESKPNDILHWTMPDSSYFFVQEEGKLLHKLPFVCDDGTIVVPEEKNYQSTVYFNFLNRVVKEVNELQPNTYLQVFAYLYSELVPSIEIDERIIVMVAPIKTNDKYSYIDKSTNSNVAIRENLMAWTKKTKNLQVYMYWLSFQFATYSRPILKVVKENLQWFKKIGVKGVTVEAKVDCSQKGGLNDAQKYSRVGFDMNEAYIWAIAKLMWDPDADIGALLARYAKIVYKECSEEMLEYFRLLQYGWDSKDASVWYTTGGDIYYLQLIIESGVADNILKVIDKAVKKAKTTSVKRKILSIQTVLEREITKYKDFVKEEAFVIRHRGEPNELLTDWALDYVNNQDSAWNRAKPLTVLRYSQSMEYYPKETNFSCRMLYDDENLYVGYTLFDEEIAVCREEREDKRCYRLDGSEITAVAETYVGGNILNQSVYYGYISGFMDITRCPQGEFYQNDGVIKKLPLPSGVKTVRYVHLDNDKTKRYLFHVQVIPFAAIGENKDTIKPYGSFAYLSDKNGCAGWMGYGLWSKQNFQEFNLEKQSEEK